MPLHTAPPSPLIRCHSSQSHNMLEVEEHDSGSESQETPTQRKWPWKTKIAEYSAMKAASASNGLGESWKPSTLKTPFHLISVALCLAFIGVLEALLRISASNGGLIFADSKTGQLPGYTLFCFEYLPTLVAVLHGLFLMWIDNDIKRLEPYFQLSKSEGVDARDSLLLDYPYQFAAFLPWNSFKRRHWVVFCSGLIALLVSYAATPLMSAVLTPKTLHRSLDFEVRIRSLVPMEQQAKILSAHFAQVAYQYKYLNGTMPRYATETFALVPFEPTELKDADLQAEETWTVNTTRYEAGLDCVAAKSSTNGFQSLGKSLTLTNGKNCTFIFEPLVQKHQGPLVDNINYQSPTTPYTGLLMSHGKYLYADPRNGVQQQLASTLTLSDENAECHGQHTLLALWNRFPYQRNKDGFLVEQPGTDDGAWAVPNNFSAVFCEPKYYEVPVEATVLATNGTVNTTLLRNLGDKVSAFSKINSTYLEDYVAFGSAVTAAPSMNVSQDYGLNNQNPFGVPNMITQMRTRSAFHELLNNGSSTTGQPVAQVNTLLEDNQSILGFAITEETNLDDLLNPDRLAEDLRQAFKMYFSFAVATELTTNSSSTLATAQRKFKSSVYVADPLFSRLLQATFAAIALLEVITIWLLHNRPLHLSNEPGSLAELIASVAVSPAVLTDFKGSDFVPVERTMEKLKASHERYKLLPPEPGKGGHRIIRVVETEVERKPLPAVPPPAAENTYMPSSRSDGPWELSKWTGFGILFAFLGLMGAFGGLYAASVKQNGLPIPPGTAFVKNLAYSYSPTVCATLVEQYLVAMARFVAVIMPFQEMHKKPTPSEKSLTVHYESHPPHFLLFKALKKLHLLFAALIVCALLANILAVALGGLFLQTQSTILQVATFNELVTPDIHAENIRTALTSYGGDQLHILDSEPGLFYAALTNASGETTYPAWTTEKFHFLPFKISQKDAQKNGHRTSETWGLGTNVSCRAADLSEVKVEPIDHLTSISSLIHPQQQLAVTVNAACHSVSNASRPPDTPVTLNVSWSLGRAEQSFMASWLNASTLYYEAQTALTDCAGTFIASWVPYAVKNGTLDQLNTTTLDIRPKADEAVNLICTAGYHAARFSVTVDASEKVHSYYQIDNSPPVPYRVNTPLSNDSQPLFGPANGSLASPAEFLAFAFQSFLFPVPQTPQQPRMDPRPQGWVAYYMQQSDPQLTLRGMNYNGTATAQAMEKVYTMLFPVFMQTYRQNLFSSGDDNTSDGDHKDHAALQGHVVSIETRMMVSLPMLILALCILALFFVVVVMLYVVSPGAFLRHVPTTLAATIPYIYASKVGEDLAWAHGPGGQDVDKYLSRGYRSYGYGWFQGRDGEMHLGVDREPVQRDLGKVLL
ncbi:hypothetical protein FN846DRAFT_915538 [Sphaerosporella brunnea]|uniref:Uncharacterized protein n=1 Tax=Sphaerosporella brunnea TaxID=1250544 RepID=A0A5J5FB63_9PEZI|nr:hypothetical protein FN846DRAFT_915538 [Sphaerosporella brunnea]